MITRLRSFILNTMTLINHRTTLKEKYTLSFLGIVFLLSTIGLVWFVRMNILVTVPAYGGTYTDAVVGVPRFINPVLSMSDADETLIKLIYSGLVRETSDGSYIPDLADYTISTDGRVYTFTLKQKNFFHDGKPVTAHDVVYTIQKIKENITPATAGWTSVEVSSTDEHTVIMKLKQPYGDFLHMATIGILPAHIWEPLNHESFQASDFNNTPIGSGPYKIDTVEYNKSGIPTVYHLDRFSRFTLGKPYLKNITIYAVVNNEELIDLINTGKISGALIPGDKGLSKTPKQIDYRTQLIPGTKYFGLFINPKSPLLSDKVIRNYINYSLDRNDIGKLFYGEELQKETPQNNTLAKNTLEKNGWKINKTTGIYEKNIGKTTTSLSFPINTLDNPDLKNISEKIKQQLLKAGISTEIHIFQPSDFEHEILAKRNYETLLFGYTIKRPSDLYAFWHSSQKNYPGLNITGYTNPALDRLLESLVIEQDTNKTKTLLEKIYTTIHTDLPVIFLYNPDDIFLSNQDIHGNNIATSLTNPADRLNTIYQWYRYTDTVWNIFHNN